MPEGIARFLDSEQRLLRQPPPYGVAPQKEGQLEAGLELSIRVLRRDQAVL